MASLIIQTGKHRGKRIELATSECLIGRHEDCKIRIASGDVSKHHCRIRREDGTIHVKDLGSRNGTFVNEEQITGEVLLKPGDTVRVGPMTFLVSEGKAQPAARTSPAAVAAKKQAATGSDADDDLIAAWLSEGGDIEKSGDDTTVDVKSPVHKSSQQPAPASVAAPSSPEEQHMQTIRDEAKAIIHRWHKQNGKG